MSNLNSYSDYPYPYKLNYLTGVSFINWNETWDFYDDIVLGNLAQQEDKPMTKHWIIEGRINQPYYETLDAATDAAKRYAKKHQLDTVTIYEAVSYVQTPTPEYTVTQLS